MTPYAQAAASPLAGAFLFGGASAVGQSEDAEKDDVSIYANNALELNEIVTDAACFKPTCGFSAGTIVRALRGCGAT